MSGLSNEKPSEHSIRSANSGGAYCFEEEAVLALARAVTNFLGNPPKFSVDLYGSETVENTDVVKLLEDDYVRSNRIRKISVSGTSDYARPSAELRRYASLTIGESEFSGVVVISISGERNACFGLKKQIDTILQSARSWYSFLYLPLSGGSLLISIALPAIVGGMFAILLTIRTFPTTDGTVHLVFFPIWIMLIALLSILKTSLFPRCLFDFGLSGKLASRSKSLQKFVGSGVLLSLVMGVIASFLYDKIK